MKQNVDIWTLDLETLRALWEGRPAPISPDQLRSKEASWREEVFFCYWKRIADGEADLDVDTLQRAIDSGIPSVGNVVGTLAMADRLGDFDRAALRHRLHVLEADDPSASWGLAQLNAREAAHLLHSGEGPNRSLLLEFLLVKGVFVILLQTLDDLSPDERAHVQIVMDQRKLLTRSQRHDIRERIRALSR